MLPSVINSVLEMQCLTRKADTILGFVPTMGFLHKGHLSLVEMAKKQCDIVIVSIFVNPTQFAPTEDLDNYPRDFDRDLKLLAELGVDYVFFPQTIEMYPPGYSTWVTVEGVSEVLCGKSRPEHFKGVSTIVCKLVNIVNPNYMYMGEKDFQQIAVLKRMLLDLNLETVIVPCPIIREDDGLAMSSRNKYLVDQQREDALCLYRSIQHTRTRYQQGCRTADELLPEIEQIITENNGKIDYIEFRTADDLKPVDQLDKNTRLFLAVQIGNTRLIDNAFITI
ncbi:MAG: pantoate--beta-alanine ligase [Candidatus Stygibacter australis]|nr:pantoate--beta-alanine ligase [Candidatus Stygibacter australis]